MLEAKAVSRATPLLRHVMPRNELSPHNARRQGTLRSWRPTPHLSRRLVQIRWQ